MPDLARVGLIQNPEDSNYADALKRAQTAAQTTGLELVPLDARVPTEIDSEHIY